MVNRRFAKLAPLAALLLAPAVSFAQVPFTPAAGGYTVVFPEQPQEKHAALSPEVKTAVYSVNRTDAAFLSSFTEYGFDVDVQKELAADMQSFVQRIDARLTGVKKTEVKLANGKSAARIEFSFEGQQSAGRGLAIMPDPHSSIMVAALSIKPADRRGEVDEFVNSFKLAAKE
jgi:hypothetical protein